MAGVGVFIEPIAGFIASYGWLLTSKLASPYGAGQHPELACGLDAALAFTDLYKTSPAIMAATGKSKTCVWRWQERFMRDSVDGLLRDKTRPPGIAKRYFNRRYLA